MFCSKFKVSKVFLLIVSTIIISCNQNKQPDKNNDFSWGKPVFKNTTTDSTLQIAHTIAPDGKTISLIFDKALNFHFVKNSTVDTTLIYSLEIPVNPSGNNVFNIKNDLRYFVSKDTLSDVRIQLKVLEKAYDIKSTVQEPSDSNESFSFLVKPDDVKEGNLKYTFQITISKKASTDDLLIQFDSLDIIAKINESQAHE